MNLINNVRLWDLIKINLATLYSAIWRVLLTFGAYRAVFELLRNAVYTITGIFSPFIRPILFKINVIKSDRLSSLKMQ